MIKLKTMELYDEWNMGPLQSIPDPLLKEGYMRVSFWNLNLIYLSQFYWLLLLRNMEFMSCHMDKAQSSHVASAQDPYLQLFPELVRDRRYITMLLVTVGQ